MGTIGVGIAQMALSMGLSIWQIANPPKPPPPQQWPPVVYVYQMPSAAPTPLPPQNAVQENQLH
jgi:hypothetical protein